MKSNNRNIFKYIFILVVISLIAGAIYILYYSSNKKQVAKEGTVTDVNETSDDVSIAKNIKMGISDYDTMNPLLTKNREIANIDKLIFEPLVNITSDYHTENCLAKQINKVSDTKYEIKLDTSIKWQDGKDFFSNDVEFTINKIKENNGLYSNNVSHIQSVETPDSETVILNLDTAVNNFEYDLDFPILPSSYYANEDFASSSKIPIGTGMYKIASIDDSTILLITNDKWRNIKSHTPKTESIEIHKYSAIGEAFNSFKLGNTDVITTYKADYSDYVGTMGYNKKEIPGRYYDFIAFNCNDDILSDSAVRKSISNAINKEGLVSSVFSGKKMVANSPIDYGTYLYDNQYDTKYDANNARKILEDDNWQYLNGKWQKTIDGHVRKLIISLMINDDNSERASVAENIKTQLSDVGIAVNIVKISSDKYYENLNNKNYQMTLAGIVNSVKPDINYFYGSGNIANYNNPDIQNAINNYNSFNDIQKIAANDCPYVGLYRNKITILLNANVGGNFSPNAFFSYYNFNEWYRQQ